jgi:hypothetical protein
MPIKDKSYLYILVIATTLFVAHTFFFSNSDLGIGVFPPVHLGLFDSFVFSLVVQGEFIGSNLVGTPRH